MLKGKMEANGDSFEKRICTLTERELRKEFDDGYGSREGEPFTCWGENHVYFPLCYDGSEWVGSAPRRPTKEAMSNPLRHQGGG